MLRANSTLLRAALPAVVLIIVAFIAPSNVRAQDMNSLKAGVVRILNNKSGDLGTGFIVRVDGNQVYIVTASHVVSGDHYPRVYLFKQPDEALRAVSLNIQYNDRTKGMALLELKVDSATAAGITALRLGNTTQIDGGEDVKIIGFPDGTTFWTVAPGSIGRVEGSELVFTGAVRGGSSGGPVIFNGLVIGMVTDASQSFAYAARVEAIELYVEGIMRNLTGGGGKSAGNESGGRPSSPAGGAAARTPDSARPAATPDNDSPNFIHRHYDDFLNRDSDTAGHPFWQGQIDLCGPDYRCREAKRVDVSSAFLLSIEFHDAGYFVYRVYKAAYGDDVSPNVPGTVPVIRLNEFLRGAQRVDLGVMVGQGNWQQQMEANKNAFVGEFLSGHRFATAFPATMTAEEFVRKLDLNAGGVLSADERAQLIAALRPDPKDADRRAQVLRSVAENKTLEQKERNRALALLAYFGYFRRNPDDPPDSDFRGWKVWLDKLDQFDGNFIKAELVKGFINSPEYRHRLAH